MTEVGDETLRKYLADYLKRAREGERIVITDHGRSIALLIPMGEAKPRQQDEPGSSYSQVDASPASGEVRRQVCEVNRAPNS
ncbi:MAG TPA: type II toxin-antitoxin system prevent-host-death family antitoxin [Thermoanaerobaculia bacterium]|nr:type II toxin-antitoxin system prevent-host-death family antitoxin [Thermoanaerobaculia bacterium]